MFSIPDFTMKKEAYRSFRLRTMTIIDMDFRNLKGKRLWQDMSMHSHSQCTLVCRLNAFIRSDILCRIIHDEMQQDARQQRPRANVNKSEQ